MVEWRSGGVVEWWSGGVVEWWSGVWNLVLGAFEGLSFRKPPLSLKFTQVGPLHHSITPSPPLRHCLAFRSVGAFWSFIYEVWLEKWGPGFAGFLKYGSPVAMRELPCFTKMLLAFHFRTR